MAITARQEHFAVLVATGKSQAEAYREAYPNAQQWKADAVWSAASRMMARGKVAARVDALRSELAERHLWSAEDSIKALKRIVIADLTSDNDRIRAIAELNKMHGFTAPKRVEETLTIERSF